MTTKNPSLAVDNTYRRRELARDKAYGALKDLYATFDDDMSALEAENARLRAALTEAEQPLSNGWDHQLELAARKQEIQRLQRALAKSERARDESVERVRVMFGLTAEGYPSAEETLGRVEEIRCGLINALAETERQRARLAKELDEEVARTPRLRQEQTARIAELEAEVEQAREYAKALAEHNDRAVAEVARMMLACRESTEILEQIHLGDPAASLIDRVCEMLTSAYQGGVEDSDDSQPAPAARIAELEAEVARLKAAARVTTQDDLLSMYVCLVRSQVDVDSGGDASSECMDMLWRCMDSDHRDRANVEAKNIMNEAECEDDDAAPAPTPATPAVPVVEVGSRWRPQPNGRSTIEVERVDTTSIHYRWLDEQGLRGSRDADEFHLCFTRLPDQPAGGGEP